MTTPGDYQAEYRKQTAIEASALAGGCFLVLLTIALFFGAAALAINVIFGG